MFIGHLGVGMAGKRLAPKVSLPVLLLAAQFADALWSILVAGGIETVRIVPGFTAYGPVQFLSFPWSHSLLMLAVWGILFGLIYRLYTDDNRGALIVGALVVSHWGLDLISHGPDVPLYPGSAKFGFGLSGHPIANDVVEVGLLAVGTVIYERLTRGGDTKGRYSFWAMILIVLLMWIGGTFGTPPRSVGALWFSALFVIVAIVVAARYVDSHRSIEQLTIQRKGRRTKPQPFY